MNLKDKGVHTIEVTFSGGGDDGSLEDCTYYNDSEKQLRINPLNNSRILRSKVDDLFYNMIEEHSQYAGDWVNNDGGYGTLNINLETNEYDLEISYRTTDTCAWDNQPFI